MAVQGTLWLAKRLSLNLNFSFLNMILYFSYQIATQLFSRGWVDPVPDPILPEKFLKFSRESNPGPLEWQSDVLSTIPNRWSFFLLSFFIYIYISECSAQGQVLHYKRRNIGCSSAEGRSSTANSGTKAAVLPGIEYVR